MRTNRRCWVLEALGLGLVVGLMISGSAGASEPAGLAEPPPASPVVELPHLTINQEQGYVDLEAVVVMREGQWLELLACSPRSREHESILTVAARPSHVHLALVMLGLEPGSPMRWRYEKEQTHVQLPSGPGVAIDILYTDAAGRPHQVPANRWVVHQETGQALASNVWLFAGSEFVEFQGQHVYRADMGGTVISLVNFGDDLLARPTDRTNMNDEAMWGCNTELIPPVDTPVTLRLRPVPGDAAGPEPKKPSQDSPEQPAEPAD